MQTVAIAQESILHWVLDRCNHELDFENLVIQIKVNKVCRPAISTTNGSWVRPVNISKHFLVERKNLSSLASGLPWGYSLYLLKETNPLYLLLSRSSRLTGQCFSNALLTFAVRRSQVLVWFTSTTERKSTNRFVSTIPKSKDINESNYFRAHP